MKLIWIKEQLKLDSPFFKELSDIWSEQIDKGVSKLPKFHWEKPD
jgi:predicted proteasome-type protease|tara:strand:+ start:156 stop:290 length:135 start_codon:yes stop_codon:yes gene_type:complete